MMDGPGTHDRHLDRGAARPRASLRASDADREWVVQQLRHHLTEGRLELDEFMDRMDTAFRSRTLGELEATLTDLPHNPVWARDVPPRPRPAHTHLHGPHRGHSVVPFAAMLFALLLLTVIWPFWPVWMLVFWAALTTFSHASGRHCRYW